MISSYKKGGVALVALLGAAFGSAQQVQVKVDGDTLAFNDVQPQIANDWVMVPARGVFEKMGATLGWDQATQTITADLNGSHIVMQVGDSVAMVNGSMKFMTLPPRIVGNRALVIARFFSDGLGQAVTWDASTYALAIDTNATANTSTLISTPAQALHRVLLSPDEVIPATLDTSLSSLYSQVGDTFTATVNGNALESYANLPVGTKIEGHVAVVKPMQPGQPAILDLAFDQITLPEGTARAIDASLLSLDSAYVSKDDYGMYTALDAGKAYQRMVLVGYDSTDGRLVGVNGSADTVADQISADESQPMDISLTPGSRIAVRIVNVHDEEEMPIH